MNWYKKTQEVNKKAKVSVYEHKEAHLINKGVGEENMYLVCQYCGRWATHPFDDKISDRQRIWKKPEQLSVDEIMESREALSQMHNEDFENITKSISHGVCPICYGIIESRGFKAVNKNEIKELSLSRK